MGLGAHKPKEGMVPWEPVKYLHALDPDEVRYSRGFLRCRPERWFPGFDAYWLPLAHALAVEFRVVDVRPFVQNLPANLAYKFVGAVDNEPIELCVDEASAQNLIEVVSPGAQLSAQKVLMEYLARRLLTSLARCWSGPESSVIRFEPEGRAKSNSVGVVRFQISCNGKQVLIWVALGRFMLERLDGLWRRQVHSTARSGDGASEIYIELAQLAVPPSMLVDYVRPGTAVDLEIPVGDSVSLRTKQKTLFPGRLRTVGNNFCVEIAPGQVSNAALPEGTTRMSVCVGLTSVDQGLLSELSQYQSMWDTGIPISDRVMLVINGEKVADAQLCMYEGRFAISVG